MGELVELIRAVFTAADGMEFRWEGERWRGLTEEPLLYPPTMGVRPEAIWSNLEHVLDIFGS